MPTNNIHDNDVTTVLKSGSCGSLHPGYPLGPEAYSVNIPDCELISELGSGGMGRVFLARQTRLNRLVAVKTLKIDNAEKTQFKDWLNAEAVTMAAMNHPNIVACHDIVNVGSRVYVIMEFVPGQMSVRDLVLRFGALPEHIVIRILLDVVNGLAYMHGKGYIHRDLKPDNLLVYNEKNVNFTDVNELFAAPGTRVKICDFGIARHIAPEDMDNPQTTQRMAMGSPNYMAPEQIFFPLETDFRADIYALGGTAMYMLTGQVPFAIAERDKIFAYKVDHDMPTPLGAGVNVSQRLSMIVEKMGRADPERRYRSYDDLLMDLEFASNLLPGNRVVGNRNEARITSFWKAISLTLFLCLFGVSIFYLDKYIKKTFFRERLVSLAYSLGFWEGERGAWSISSYNDEIGEMVMFGTQMTKPLRLMQFILPGQSIEFMVKHPGSGSMFFQLSDEGGLRGRLLWNRDEMGRNCFSFYSSGQLYPIDGIDSRFGNDWLCISFKLMKKGIVLHMDGEPVCIVHGRATKPSRFTVNMSSANMMLLKKVYIYNSEE